MRKLIVVFLAYTLLFCSLPSSVSATTTEGLEWGAETGDRFYYNFNYWVAQEGTPTYTDEEFYIDVNTTELVIPDPLDSWDSMPIVPHIEAWANGSEADLLRFITIYAWSVLVPIGNWSLLSSITEDRTILGLGGPGGFEIQTTMEINDWFRWGFNYTFFNDEWDYEIHVAFTKANGALASFSLIAYTHATGELFGVITAVRDGVPPFSFHPSDMTIESGDDGNQISWEVYDKSESSYMVYRNDSCISNGTWNGDSTFVNVTLNDLEIGNYEYRLELTDAGGNSTEDIVIVHVVDTTPPNITSPDDISYEETTTGHLVVWTPSDLNPASYSILLDGITIESGDWDGDAITLVVDGHTMGTYTYTLIVTDSSGNSIQDDVVVNVTISTMTLAFLGVGGVVIIGAAVVLNRRRSGGSYDPTNFDFHY